MKQVYYALNEQVAEKFGPFQTKDEAQKAIVEEVKKGSPVFGWELEEKEVKSWKDIKTFQDAVACLGNNNKYVEAYYHAIGVADDEEDAKELLGVDVVAFLKLRIIMVAINEGWEPKFTEDEWRYYPWFYLFTEEEYSNFSEEKKQRCVLRACSYAFADGGLVYASAYVASSNSSAGVGARLAFESEEKAKHAGVYFKELWADFCFREAEKNN